MSRIISASRQALAVLILNMAPMSATEGALVVTDWSGLSVRELILLGLAVALSLALIFGLLFSRKNRPRPYAYLYRIVGRKLAKSEVTTPVFRIGRHPNNELRIRHRSVSRFHAELVRNNNGSFTIYDTNSRNGVRVGLRPVHSRVLKESDVIDIGEVRFRFTRYPRDFNTFRHTEMIDAPVSRRFALRRRRTDRQKILMDVRVYHDESGWINGRVLDLSTDGAFVEVDRQIEPRAPVDIVFPIIQGSQRRWFRLTGEVVRENNDGVGITFSELDDSTAHLLASLSKAA